MKTYEVVYQIAQNLMGNNMLPKHSEGFNINKATFNNSRENRNLAPLLTLKMSFFVIYSLAKFHFNRLNRVILLLLSFL